MKVLMFKIYFGYRYSAKNKKKSQLLNFLMGEAKMAVYISRRNKVEGEEVCEIVPIFKNRVKARVWVDFKFFKMMKDLMFFQTIWCYNDAICSIVDDSLIFSCLL